MSESNKVNYNHQLYKIIADLYIIDKLSINKACAKINITPRAYYKICKKLSLPSVVELKDARFNFIDNDKKDITDDE
jgi:hypothetical protein